MEKSFIFTVYTVDGEIQAFPFDFTFSCEMTMPIGFHTIRDYNVNMDIVATNVFLVKYGGRVYGTKQFSSLAAFVNFKNGKCHCCDDRGCGIYLNGCFVTLNGCSLLMNKTLTPVIVNQLQDADTGNTLVVDGDSGIGIVTNPN